MTHITKVADKIPTELADTRLKKNNANEPLTPISVIAIVGTIEITNSIVDVKMIEFTYEISISKICNRMKN